MAKFYARPGLVFRHGKLVIFGSTQILVVRQWPDIRGWRKTEQRGWHPWRPVLNPRVIRLLDPRLKSASTSNEPNQTLSCAGRSCLLDDWIRYKQARKRRFDEAAWGFSEAIPLEVRRAVRSFEQSHYEVLQAFARVDYALELYRSNPALFYALVRNDHVLTTSS